MVSAQQPTGLSPWPAGQGRAGGGRALRRHMAQRPFAVTCARGTDSVPAVGGSLRGPLGQGRHSAGPGRPPQGPAQARGLGDIFWRKTHSRQDGFLSGQGQVVAGSATGGAVLKKQGQRGTRRLRPRGALSKAAGGPGR